MVGSWKMIHFLFGYVPVSFQGGLLLSLFEAMLVKKGQLLRKGMNTHKKKTQLIEASFPWSDHFLTCHKKPLLEALLI